MSSFEDIGGEPKLRAIIDDFVDACFDDMMIGFLFQKAGASRERIKRFEYQHAAEHLGADVRYGGRPIGAAHQRHRIFGGQFDRRATILRRTLEKHGVPEDIRDAWLARQEALRAQITADRPGECVAED